jgi:fermentation-respiration switch protein FrsA (DUF1100 family)
MKRHLQTEDDAEATLVEPRFDEKAIEAAHPVVPLSQVRGAGSYRAGHAWGPRRGAGGWPRGMIIMLAVVALLAAVAASAVYRSGRTVAPSPAAQAITEAGAAEEPEAVESVPERAAETPAEPRTRENVTAASEKSPREPEARGGAALAREVSVVPAREEPEARKETERRAGNEEKFVERARKDEKKRAKKEEKQAERQADKHDDNDRREETRPRLVGIYTERRKY